MTKNIIKDTLNRISEVRNNIVLLEAKFKSIPPHRTGYRNSLTLQLKNAKKHILSLTQTIKDNFMEGNVLQVTFMMSEETYQVNLTNISPDHVKQYLEFITAKSIEILEIKEIRIKDTLKLLSQKSN